MTRSNKQHSINEKTAIPCILCNPKKYLKFNFSFINYESSNKKDQDVLKCWERLRWLSSKTFPEMIFEFGRNKDKWFEKIPFNQIKKEIPSKFREIFPTETNEEYWVIRVYPAGTPAGTANPRIIGIVRNTIFYIFYLDWDGKLYSHGK
mgnify:CR=1 FL=1